MTPPVPALNPTSALAIKLAIAGVQRIPSSGLARIRDYIRGREVLVVGPKRVGKTSFVTYLQHGILLDEGSTVPSYDPRKTPTFTVALGTRQTLELRLRSVEDLPGHIGPTEQANLVAQRRPHALVMVLDLSLAYGGRSPDSAQKWLKTFFGRLEHKWAQRHSKNRIRSFLVLLNKRDKVSAASSKKYQQQVNRILQTACPLTTSGLDGIPVLETTLVASPEGSHFADNAVSTLARTLA